MHGFTDNSGVFQEVITDHAFKSATQFNRNQVCLGFRRLILGRDALHKRGRAHESRREKTAVKIPVHVILPQSLNTVLVTTARSTTNTIRCGFYPGEPARFIEFRQAETNTHVFGAQALFSGGDLKNFENRPTSDPLLRSPCSSI